MGYRGYAEANGFIVAADNTGDFTSIAAAITAAVAAGGSRDIFIKEGTYTENLTLQPNINLICWPSNATSLSVSIVGTLSYSGTGRVTVHSLTLSNNGANPIVNVSGAVQSQLILSNCFFPLTADGIVFSSSHVNSFVTLDSCNGFLTNGGIKFFNDTSAGTLNIQYTEIGNFGAGATIAAIKGGTGFMGIDFSYLFFPISITTTSIASHIQHSIFELSSVNKAAVTLTGTGAISSYYSLYSTGTATSLVINAGTQFASVMDVIVTSNATTLSGAGTLVYGLIVFVGTHNITVTTQNPLFVKAGNVFLSASQQSNVTTPGGYPYTIVPDQDYYILGDSSAPHTIKLPATPNAGDTYIIKDSTGTSATNNITVDGNGNNIDAGSTYIIDSNYSSFTFIFNGTIWNIF